MMSRLRLLAEQILHGLAIELAVGLGARAAHGRALAPVQHPELDAAAIGRPRHHAVERIDLADEMALAEPADRRIAGHHADGLGLMRHQRRARAEPRRSGGGLDAGMAAADDDDVIAVCDRSLGHAVRYRTRIQLVNRLSDSRRVSRETPLLVTLPMQKPENS